MYPIETIVVKSKVSPKIFHGIYNVINCKSLQIIYYKFSWNVNTGGKKNDFEYPQDQFNINIQIFYLKFSGHFVFKFHQKLGTVRLKTLYSLYQKFLFQKNVPTVKTSQ